jgi:membrane dipeptidase
MALPALYQPETSGELRARLGISAAAAELFVESHVIDLHIESYSFYRSFGYHPHKYHSGGVQRGLLVGQADLPRLRRTGINGATWVITANPLRPAQGRSIAFKRQFHELRQLLDAPGAGSKVVTNVSEYMAATQRGYHACFLGVQGANAFPEDPQELSVYAPWLLRITLMHLSNTAWGTTSAPSLRLGNKGLTNLAFDFIAEMNLLKVGVDLAHIHPHGFWDAVRANDSARPLMVSHTGVSGAHAHWRNLDDAQLRAIADSGGTVGIMYHSMYLGDPLFAGRISSIVRHIEHALSVVGEDHVSLGSDWDGAICTPRDMPTCAELPLLVDALLNRNVSERAVRKILGQNFLRVVALLKDDVA